MDNRTLGLIIIGVILMSIIAAFILNSKFREDVITGEGGANILGLINVRGVVIVLLTAILGGMFIYIIQLNPIVDKIEITTGMAINHLEDAKDVIYSINGENDSILSIVANSKNIGKLSEVLNKDLSATKSLVNNKYWNIGILKSPLGFIKVENENGYIKWNERDSISRDSYKVGEPYKLKNMDLWFRIDSINREYNRRTKYKYFLTFGEGEIVNSIRWRNITEQFTKTPDGRVYLTDEFKPIRNSDWQNDYYIKFGAGQPSTVEPELSSVEKINMIALGLRID